jgi:hypothetical protein
VKRDMTAETIRYVVLHAALAAAFGFVLNRYLLASSTETALLWAAAFGAAAAGLAWYQKNR